jgi:hypothetical protein
MVTFLMKNAQRKAPLDESILASSFLYTTEGGCLQGCILLMGEDSGKGKRA